MCKPCLRTPVKDVSGLYSPCRAAAKGRCVLQITVIFRLALFDVIVAGWSRIAPASSPFV